VPRRFGMRSVKKSGIILVCLLVLFAGCDSGSGGGGQDTSGGQDVAQAEDSTGGVDTMPREDTPCLTSCEGKVCGEDGCGGSCGVCDTFANSFCTEAGICDCTVDCDGKNCGDNGCGGTCGDCGLNQVCGALRVCECANVACLTACCDAGQVCHADACCTPACDGKDCGPDGCGGICGECGDDETCSPEGLCEPDGVICGENSVPEGTCTTDDGTDCTCVGCVDDGECTVADDCVCPDCVADGWCSDPANCTDDGACSPFNEGCGCADCPGHIECFLAQ